MYQSNADHLNLEIHFWTHFLPTQAPYHIWIVFILIYLHTWIITKSMLCDGLDQNVSHGLIYLKAWSPFGGTVGGGLGGVALLEEKQHYGWALKFQNLVPFPVPSCPSPSFSLCFVLKVKDVHSQRPAPASVPDACYYASLTWWTSLLWSCKHK